MQIRLWIRPNGVYPLPCSVQATEAEQSHQHEQPSQAATSSSAAAVIISEEDASVALGDAGSERSHHALNHKHRSSHWKAAKKSKKAAAAAAAAGAAGTAAAGAAGASETVTTVASQPRPSRFQCG